jgi:hypothetical protein
MAIGNAPVEAPVTISATQGSAQVRELVVTLLVNNVPTPVVMQVVSLANADGTLLDMNLLVTQRQIIDLLSEVLRETKIQNELLVQGFNVNIDLEAEYRADPMFGSAGSIAGT